MAGEDPVLRNRRIDHRRQLYSSNGFSLEATQQLRGESAMTNELESELVNSTDIESEHPHLETMKAHVPFGVFFLAAFAQLAAVMAAFWLIAPRVLSTELAQPWRVLLWTFLLGVPLSLFEYLYHRYLLHSAVLPFMGAMARAHGNHHGLTDVRAPVKAHEPEKLATVVSEYPVEEKHQEESMMFPLYSALIFVPVFMIFIGFPVKAIFPSEPIVTALIGTVMLYYCGYEVWHALLHLPFEKFWEPRMGSSVVRRVYGFHLMHHWRPTANLAIIGFWGVAVWDHLFRTHHRPKRMPLNQAQVSYVDGSFHKPRWPISQLDRWQGGLARTSRRLERFFAHVFLGKRQPR